MNIISSLISSTSSLADSSSPAPARPKCYPAGQHFFPYMSPRNYLLMDMQRDLEDIRARAACFPDLRVGDKLGFDTDTGAFFINRNTMFQSLSRIYYAQNREKTYYYVKQFVDGATRFAKQCLAYIETNIVSRSINNTYEDTCRQLLEFMDLLSQTIGVIIRTYTDCCGGGNVDGVSAGDCSRLIMDYRALGESVADTHRQVLTFLETNDREKCASVVFHGIEDGPKP
jgi:hypothetical protein